MDGGREAKKVVVSGFGEFVAREDFDEVVFWGEGGE